MAFFEFLNTEKPARKEMSRVNQPVIIEQSPQRVSGLEALHDELGTLRWVGQSKDYDKVIEDVRRRIRDILSSNRG